MEIQFGEGGDDSKLFVDDLSETYIRWAELNKVKHEEIYRKKGKVSLRFTGNNAYDIFKNEAGKHCVQRVPPTESKGRRHTSFISVAVLPLKPSVSISLNENEVEIKTQGGHGKGGQHQNKTDSAVRATHTPTGIQVFINGRKQQRNKKLALEILANKVEEFYQNKKLEKYNQNRKNQLGDGSRSGKTRTYNFIDSRVIDHNLGTKTSKIKKVMKGQLQHILK